MGHQVCLYLTKNDEVALLATLSREANIELRRVVFFEENERVIAQLLQDFDRSSAEQQIAITSSESAMTLLYDTFPEGHTRLDLGESEVVEFSRSRVAGNQARPGRLWYRLDSRRGTKSDAFKKWARELFGFVKSSLSPIHGDGLDGYAGPELVELLRSKAVALSAW
jgi:hypothetical protein